MSTTAFLQRYDSFPEQMKEDLSIISEYLLFYYQPKANAARSNFIKPSSKALTNEEQTILAENAESDLLEGRFLSQLEAKSIAKTWRKK